MKINFLQKCLLTVGATTAIAMGLAMPAKALDFSFTGTFNADDDVQFFDFSVGSPSEVTLRSWSYAGGIQADGNVVEAGGFDPILAIFDSAGELIFEQDDAGNDGFVVDADPVSERAYDTFYTVELAAGDYTTSVAQFYNFFEGSNLNTGSFSDNGFPFFTSVYGCSNGQFCDTTGANRTNEWAFDILNVESAAADNGEPIPTPAVILPMVMGMFGAASRRKNKLENPE